MKIRIIALLMLSLGLLSLPALFSSGASCAAEPNVTAQPAAAGTPQMPGMPGSDGQSLTPSSAPDTYFDIFLDKFRQGGLTMYFLLFLSVAGIAIILERLANLRERNIITPGLSEAANRLFQQGKYEELNDLCASDRSLLSRLILIINEHRDCHRDDLQSLADDIGSREVRLLGQKAYPLAIIATLSPLLGLYGTVIGMIGAFDTVAQAGDMGNASILADDIAKALITTAGGLIVAIPMLGFYHYFRHRANRFAILLEEEISALYSLWFLRSRANGGEADRPGSGNAGE